MKMSDRLQIAGLEWTMMDSVEAAVLFVFGLIPSLFLPIVGGAVIMFVVAYAVMKYGFPWKTGTIAVVSAFIGSLFPGILFSFIVPLKTYIGVLCLGMLAGQVLFYVFWMGFVVRGFLSNILSRKLIQVK